LANGGGSDDWSGMATTGGGGGERVSDGRLGMKTRRRSGLPGWWQGDDGVQTVEASGSFGPAGQNGGEAGEAQTRADAQGEARGGI
jgi:hypothetical protein